MELKRVPLIGLMGKSGSGKDEVASIIQYLTSFSDRIKDKTYSEVKSDLNVNYSNFIIKKFADKLKDMLCILIGCSRTDLEDREFKERELSEDWRVYYRLSKNDVRFLLTKKQYEDCIKYSDIIKKKTGYTYHTEILTPRKLMLLLGTESGRKIISPDLWVISLFNDFKPRSKGRAHNLETDGFSELYSHKSCDYCNKQYTGFKRQRFCKECIENDDIKIYPNWIVSDVRMKNEWEAITKHSGTNIGIKRYFRLRFPKYAHLEDKNDLYAIPDELNEINPELYRNLNHESETMMGDLECADYVVENNGTLEELVGTIREILIKEEFIFLE